MREALALYGRYIGISIRAQMQYRASFWLMAFSQFAATGIEFLGLWALFARFGSLRGWSLPEVAFFYGVVNVAFALADALARGFDVFPNLVKSGDFDRLLLRPRPTAFQVAAQELTLMRAGRLAQGVAVLAWALEALRLSWSLPKTLLLVGTVLGGTALFCGLFVLQATMAFWTVETLEIMNTVTYGGTETGQYPLTIYRPWFRRFFTFVVPLAFLNYVPARALLDRPGLPDLPLWLPWLAPGVGFLFLFLTLQLWKVGVRHYTSTGS